MEKLNFYLVDLEYTKYLQTCETAKRGFSRVPNLDYSGRGEPKFLCGVVLKVEEHNYFVPVTSYVKKQENNILIYNNSDKAVSSLRFNYMIPVPAELLRVREIDSVPNFSYRALLSQELKYCQRNHERILKKANKTYQDVIRAYNPGLVHNSCDFKLLEEKCIEYCMQHKLLISKEMKTVNVGSLSTIKENLSQAQKTADKMNTRAENPTKKDPSR